MAKPRIFLSSTFYDLRHVRGELERFIREMGYDPVLNERGNITYGSEKALEEYCYQEIEKVHIVVSIIGGRYGTQSALDGQYSISNMELRTALAQKKQVYVFIESGVMSEYRTYVINKDRDIKYSHVDDRRVYEFIDQIYSMPFNNQVAGFDNIPWIINYLKEQWAGLFERYLQKQSEDQVLNLAQTIVSTAETLKGLVDLFRREREGDEAQSVNRLAALESVILQNHPVFAALRKLTWTKYRIFFTNRQEFIDWLSSSRSGAEVDPQYYDDKDFIEFIFQARGKKYLLKISAMLFDDRHNLVPMLPGDWSDNYISVREFSEPKPDDEEVPF